MKLRPATLDDEAFLLTLRNDGLVRAGSRNRDVIHPKGHAEWLRHTLADPHVFLYIAETVDGSVGMARLDCTLDGAAEVSLAVVSTFRRRGYGREIVRLLVDEAKVKEQRIVTAAVRGGNIPSLRAFLSNGFTPEGWLYLQRPLRDSCTPSA